MRRDSLPSNMPFPPLPLEEGWGEGLVAFGFIMTPREMISLNKSSLSHISINLVCVVSLISNPSPKGRKGVSIGRLFLNHQCLPGCVEFLVFLFSYGRVCKIQICQGFNDRGRHHHAGEPFIIGRYDIPGRVVGSRVLNRVFVRLHIVAPVATFLRVIDRKFPVLVWSIEPRQKTLL